MSREFDHRGEIPRAALIPNPDGRSGSARWERRLAELHTLSAEDGARASSGLVTAVREIFEFLDRLGVDTDDLRIFVNQLGHFEIERRDGRAFRTLEVSADGVELHEVDLEANASVTRRVDSPRTAGRSLMFPVRTAA